MANPNYYADKGKIDIEYSYITDSTVAFEAYKNNEFDIVGRQPRTARL